MQKTLIIVGIVVLLAGLAWPWLARLPLGRLPGDIVIERADLKIYIPVTTMLIASLVITVLLWLFRR